VGGPREIASSDVTRQRHHLFRRSKRLIRILRRKIPRLALAKKRRQHHVWQHYLKAWSTDGQLYCLMNEADISDGHDGDSKANS
jgi:hypothetical protein